MSASADPDLGALRRAYYRGDIPLAAVKAAETAAQAKAGVQSLALSGAAADETLTALLHRYAVERGATMREDFAHLPAADRSAGYRSYQEALVAIFRHLDTHYRRRAEAE